MRLHEAKIKAATSTEPQVHCHTHCDNVILALHDPSCVAAPLSSQDRELEHDTRLASPQPIRHDNQCHVNDRGVHML